MIQLLSHRDAIQRQQPSACVLHPRPCDLHWGWLVRCQVPWRTDGDRQRERDTAVLHSWSPRPAYTFRHIHNKMAWASTLQCGTNKALPNRDAGVNLLSDQCSFWRQQGHSARWFEAHMLQTCWWSPANMRESRSWSWENVQVCEHVQVSNARRDPLHQIQINWSSHISEKLLYRRRYFSLIF